MHSSCSWQPFSSCWWMRGAAGLCLVHLCTQPSPSCSPSLPAPRGSVAFFPKGEEGSAHSVHISTLLTFSCLTDFSLPFGFSLLQRSPCFVGVFCIQRTLPVPPDDCNALTVVRSFISRSCSAEACCCTQWEQHKGWVQVTALRSPLFCRWRSSLCTC